MITRTTSRLGPLLCLGLFFGCGAETDDASEAEPQAPLPASQGPEATESATPSVSYPYRVEPACPGEGCSLGQWLACDSVPLLDTPRDGAPLGHLVPGSLFEVSSGAMIVDSPTVVLATEPTRQLRYSSDALTFAPGDTIYILHYLGEGFFKAVYADSILDVEAFWPWNEFASPSDGYSGQVLRQGSASFWVRTVDATGGEAWISVDEAKVSAPNALDPDPPACRVPTP